MKKILTIIISLIALFSFASCCNDDPTPYGVGMIAQVYKSEEFNWDNIFIGIQASLRNDSISSEILREKKTDSDGEVAFYLRDKEFKDCYVTSFEEIEKIENDETDFYIVINDPESKSYNPSYETKKIEYNKSQADSCIRKIYLPSKK